MSTTQIPLFETEIKELQDKIHCLMYDIQNDLQFHVNEIRESKKGLRDQWKKECIDKHADDLEYVYQLMLSRVGYYLEKWIDKKDFADVEKARAYIIDGSKEKLK